MTPKAQPARPDWRQPLIIPHPRWAELCPLLIRHIALNYPWWFDGSEGIIATFSFVRFVSDGYRDYPGEECCICQAHPDGHPVLEAVYSFPQKHFGSSQLTFFAHVRCVESLLPPARGGTTGGSLP